MLTRRAAGMHLLFTRRRAQGGPALVDIPGGEDGMPAQTSESRSEDHAGSAGAPRAAAPKQPRPLF